MVNFCTTLALDIYIELTWLGFVSSFHILSYTFCFKWCDIGYTVCSQDFTVALAACEFEIYSRCSSILCECVEVFCWKCEKKLRCRDELWTWTYSQICNLSWVLWLSESTTWPHIILYSLEYTYSYALQWR